jgi:hypothetical protein
MIRAAVFALLFAAAFSAGDANAQDHSAPPGWQWRLDSPAPLVSQHAVPDSAWRFEQMPRGWHITTGPSGLLYPAAERASGMFSLAADFVVFPETTESAFGIFLGGSGLEDDAPTYVAAVLRRDGAFSVIRRVRGAEAVLIPWTRHSAIKPHPGSGVVTNRLRVNASADPLRVFVNDSAVARISLENAVTEGSFGFKVGERVNLHLTILDLIRHLAPARSR